MSNINVCKSSGFTLNERDNNVRFCVIWLVSSINPVIVIMLWIPFRFQMVVRSYG